MTTETKVEHCEYSHQWATVDNKITCAKCGAFPTAKQMESAEAIIRLREWVKPGETIHCQIKNVSRSGMSRVIQLLKLECGKNSEPSISYLGYNAHLAGVGSGYDRNREGVKVGGCGMDMGFALVYELSHVLYPEYKCLGKGKCPSNYHSNHHDRVRCNGVGTGDDWSPCYPSNELRLVVKVKGVSVEGRHAFVIRTPRIGEDGIEEICPTCKGEGYTANPDGPERFNLLHKDGYALRHKWI